MPTPFTEAQLIAEVQRQANKVRGEQPTEQFDVQPMNWFDEFVNQHVMPVLGRNPADATTTGKMHIRYDPKVLLNRTPDDLGDMITHELKHGDQHPGFIEALINTQTKPSYYQYPNPGTDPTLRDPEELEAFQAEADRRARQHRRPTPGVGPDGNRTDIYLPPERK